MKIASKIYGLTMILGTGALVATTINYTSDRPSQIVRHMSKRYVISAESSRSVYRAEPECKNAVPSRLWLECEPANRYYGEESSYSGYWLGPVFNEKTDPYLSLSAQNLPISTVKADSRNVSLLSSNRLLYELRLNGTTSKQISQSSTKKFTRRVPERPESSRIGQSGRSLF